MFNGKIIEDFISKENCSYLINAAVASDLWQTAGHEFWDNRTINYTNMIVFDKKAADIMIDVLVRCQQSIKESYGLEKIYPDLLQVIRWFPGMQQAPHADDMSNTDITGHAHRAFGSVLYLNDDYEGGHTYYPNFNFDITPKAGTLAFHPADVAHLHGVTEVKDSIRYTVASFWTKQKNMEMKYREQPI
jgi:prolyl 4-hydroxylase